jgi:hypothetical protein
MQVKFQGHNFREIISDAFSFLFAYAERIRSTALEICHAGHVATSIHKIWH